MDKLNVYRHSTYYSIARETTTRNMVSCVAYSGPGHVRHVILYSNCAADSFGYFASAWPENGRAAQRSVAQRPLLDCTMTRDTSQKLQGPKPANRMLQLHLLTDTRQFLETGPLSAHLSREPASTRKVSSALLQVSSPPRPEPKALAEGHTSTEPQLTRISDNTADQSEVDSLCDSSCVKQLMVQTACHIMFYCPVPVCLVSSSKRKKGWEETERSRQLA